MSGGRIHRMIRACWSHYPMRFGAAWLNRRLDRFFDRPEPDWMLAPGRGAWPTMVLNVASNLQRKFFYFPKVYGRFYGKGPFAAYLPHKLTSGSRFIEIGANVGFFSLQAARLVGPQGRVYAFEPEPVICESLTRSASANSYGQLETFQLALSDREDEATFFRARDGTASSLVPEAAGNERRYERTLTTRVTTLDKLVDEGRIDPKNVSLIKVDVEGEEVRTVGGMLETLVAASYPAIWCEVRGPQGSTRAPDTFVGVNAKLAQLGYRPFWWVNGTKRPVADGEVTARTDVLFERA